MLLHECFPQRRFLSASQSKAASLAVLPVPHTVTHQRYWSSDTAVFAVSLWPCWSPGLVMIAIIMGMPQPLSSCWVIRKLVSHFDDAIMPDRKEFIFSQSRKLKMKLACIERIGTIGSSRNWHFLNDLLDLHKSRRNPFLPLLVSSKQGSKKVLRMYISSSPAFAVTDTSGISKLSPVTRLKKKKNKKQTITFCC